MKPKFYYFDIPFWRGEATRILFFLGSYDVEDIRLSHEEFEKLKASGKFPHNKIPILEVNGRIIMQSAAICKYVAKQVSLFGKSPLEEAIHDAMFHLVDEANTMLQCTWTHDKQTTEEQKKMRTNLALKYFPSWCIELETLISNKDFTVGSELMASDVLLYCFVKYLQDGGLDGLPTSIFKDFSKIQRVYNNVKNDSRIKLYNCKDSK